MRLAYLVPAIAMFTATPSLAEVVYSQAGTQACNPSCWTSNLATAGGFRAFDNFTLSSAANITSVTWQGIYIPNPATGGPPSPNTINWDIGFYSDSGNFPGTALYSANNVPAANVTATQIGTGTFGAASVNLYSFSYTLPSVFAAAAGTQYWFSPVAHSATFNPFFSWSPATNAVDGRTAQIDSGNNTFIRPNDRAFSLTASVPEPSSWALLILGFGLVGANVRRIRRQNAVRFA